MKIFNFYRLFTIVLIVFSTTTSNLLSQTDSIATLPLFPNDTEETKLICYMKLNSSPCYLDSSMVEVENDTIHVKLFYAMGSMSSICERVDTLNLGVLNVGSYTIQTEKYHVQINDTLLYNTIYLSVNIGHLSIEDVFSSNSINLYPNPTSDLINIEFQLNDPEAVSLTIYDLQGKTIATPTIGDKDQGNHKVTISTAYLPKGIYLVQMNVGKEIITQKIVRL